MAFAMWLPADAPRSLAGGFSSITLVAAPAVQPWAPMPLRNSFEALGREVVDDDGESIEVLLFSTLADHFAELRAGRSPRSQGCAAVSFSDCESGFFCGFAGGRCREGG